MRIAARWPADTLPTNSQFFLPIAVGFTVRSLILLFTNVEQHQLARVDAFSLLATQSLKQFADFELELIELLLLFVDRGREFDCLLFGDDGALTFFHQQPLQFFNTR